MTRYIIVDDEPLAHDLIKKFAEDLPHMELVQQCYNAMEAMQYLSQHQVDLMFLDINMPKLTGFELLRSLPSTPSVIVTSAYQEYAIEGYELSIVDYLLKPFSFGRFVTAVNKALTSQSPAVVKDAIKSTSRFFVKGDKQYHQIDIDTLLYVEAYGNYTKLHLQDEMILCHESISSLSSTLSTDDYMRVHKSYIVSLSHIDRIAANRIYIDQHIIPVGQTYKRDVMELIGRG